MGLCIGTWFSKVAITHKFCCACSPINKLFGFYKHMLLLFPVHDKGDLFWWVDYGSTMTTWVAGLTLLENFRWTSASSWRLFFSWIQASPTVLQRMDHWTGSVTLCHLLLSEYWVHAFWQSQICFWKITKVWPMTIDFLESDQWRRGSALLYYQTAEREQVGWFNITWFDLLFVY